MVGPNLFSHFHYNVEKPKLPEFVQISVMEINYEVEYMRRYFFGRPTLMDCCLSKANLGRAKGNSSSSRSFNVKCIEAYR